MLLFWCHWFKYRLIKIDLVTVGKYVALIQINVASNFNFNYNFSRALGGVIDCVNVNPSKRA